MTKDVTLVIVDTKNHDLAKFSIEKTLSVIDCREVLTFSNREIIQGARFAPVTNVNNLYDYSEIVLKQLWPFINTTHALVIQWDGMAVNADQWTDEFLKYDYIGAVWPWPIRGQAMGNGGFSLRSRKLIDACRDTQITLGGTSGQDEDIAICVDNRKLLQEKYNIQYAPLELARQFSTENEWLGSPTFGFHGIWNAVRYLPRSDLEYILENMPLSFWDDMSKVKVWLQVLVDNDFTDLAEISLEKYNTQL